MCLYEKIQIDNARAITVTCNHPVLSYDGVEELKTNYSNLILSIQAIGFNNPEIKVTGTGYNTTDQSAETSYVVSTPDASTRTVTVHAAAYNSNPLAYASGASLDFTIEAREKDNPSRTRTVTYSITKTLDSAGVGAKAVSLKSSHYTVIYNTEGVSPTPSTSTDVTITADSAGFSNAYFKFTGDGITDEGSYTDGTGANQDTFRYEVPADMDNFVNPSTVTVSVSEADQTAVATDKITIFAVKSGTDAYTVVNTNQAHAIPIDTNNSNTPSYVGSGTQIRVWKGATLLNAIHTGNAAAGTFKVTASGTGITPSSTNSSHGTATNILDPVNTLETIVYTAAGSMSAATAEIQYSIDIEGIQTVTSSQTFNKNATGEDGTPGLSNGIVYLYKLHTSSSSAPTRPDSGSSTYTFATKALTETTSGDWDNWVKDIPTKTATNPYIWIIAATVSSTGDTDTISYSEWATPVLYSAEGYQTAKLYLYQRTSSATSPAKPNNNLTWNFANANFGVNDGDASLDGWKQVIPTSGGDYIHITTATALAIAADATDIIAGSEWADATVFAQPGDSGLNQSTISLYYLNNDSSSAPTLVNNNLYWNFAEKKLVQSTGTTTTLADGHASLDGWKQAFPATTDTLGVRWVTMAVASANSGEDTIAAGDWSAPVVIGDDKSIKNHQVDLYQRDTDTTPPADPNNDLYWNFDNGHLVVDSGSTTNLADGHASLDSWTQVIPATGAEFIFKISAMALGNASATQDVIEPGDWSAASLISVPGEDGEGGYTLTASNNNHTFIGTKTGVVGSNDFTNTFTVKRGDTTLAYNTGTGTTDTWRFSVGPAGSGGVATNKITNSSGVLTVANDSVLVATGTSTLTGGITGTIVDNNGSGADILIGTFAITLTKTLVGETGDEGLKLAEVDLYYELAAGSYTLPNAAPSTGTYNFGSNVVASIPSGWSQTKPAVKTGQLAAISKTLATEATSGGGVSGSLTWTTPTLYSGGVSSTDFIFKYMTSAGSAPSATAYSGSLPSGWSTSIPNNPNDGKKLFSSKGVAALTGTFPNFSFNFVWQTPVVHVQAKSDVGLANVPDVDMTNLSNATGGTLATSRGGTGLGSILTLLNSRITTNANGTINYDGTLAVAPSIASIGGTLAVSQGGTGQTNTNKFLNSGITVSQSGSTFTITRGDGTGDTTTISKGVLGLNYTDGADVTGSNTAADTAAVNGTAASTVRLNAARAAVGLDANGNVARTVPATHYTNTTYANLGALDSTANTKLTGIATGADVTGSNTAADTALVNGTAAATVKNGAALGASANQTSTADIRNGITTFERSQGDVFWSNLSGNLTPSQTSFPVTITWRNGSGTSLGTSVVTISLASTTALAAAVTTSNGASATISAGPAANAGAIQTSTVTKNGIVCTIKAQIIDGSGWTFK